MTRETYTSDRGEALKAQVLKVLSRHPSPARCIKMAELHRQVFGEAVREKINTTRKLRKVITALRAEGTAIGSTADADGGGYYLATTDKDLSDYCRRLRSQGLAKLKLEADIRRMTLPQLMREVHLNLEAS